MATAPPFIPLHHINLLKGWLKGNIRAWHGWPTTAAVDRAEAVRRLRRLKAHGCPVDFSDGFVVLTAVEQAIQQIRREQRREYRRRVGEFAF